MITDGTTVVYNIHEKTVWLPTVPPRPAPEVMSAQDAVLFLGLPPVRGLKTLEYYRVQGKLKGVRIGHTTKYRLAELQRFVREQEAET